MKIKIKSKHIIIAIIVFVVIAKALSIVIPNDKISVIDIQGVIGDSRKTVERIESLYNDNSVKGVILRINSPGGSSGVSQEIYMEIKRLSEKKPVYASLGNMAASGGIYVSFAANKIYALPSTVTGSIGVVVSVMNFKGVLDKLGVTQTKITSGKQKAGLSRYSTPSKETIENYSLVLAQTHKQFIKAARTRGVSEENIVTYTDGRIFTGEESVRIGFADGIDTLMGVKRRLESDLGSEYELDREEQGLTIMDYLLSSVLKSI